MATKKKDNLSDTQKIGIGIGLTAAVAAAAGSYFLYGSKNAAKNRKAVKSWTLKAKAEVLETLEKAQQMSKEEYEQLIDTVGTAYSQVKDASKMDVSAFKNEMKEYWKNIEKNAKGGKSTVKKVAKSAAKGAAKGAAVSAAKEVSKKSAPKKAAKKAPAKKATK